MQVQVVRTCLLIFALWILTTFMLAIIPRASDKDDLEFPDSTQESKIVSRIEKAFKELDSLEEIKVEIQNVMEKRRQLHNAMSESTNKKFSKYELNRRYLETALKELMYTIRSRNATDLEEIRQITDIYRLLEGGLLKMRNMDGYEAMRVLETQKLSNIVQERIHSLQNPKDCESSKKLICALNKDCGFGCQIHHVCYCLIVAYASGRMLVLDSRDWRYNSAGWEAVFEPLSDRCGHINMNSIDVSHLQKWNSSSPSNADMLFLPIVDELDPIPPFLPPAIPSDISDKLVEIHGEPHVWWVGQLISYIFRLKPQLRDKLNLDDAKLGSVIQPGTVGIHVRRTDKIGTEAAYHPLEEYMYYADEYFAILESSTGSEIQRRVFIASDDPFVILEARSKYRERRWKILANAKTAMSASVKKRYNDAGLNGIIKDVVLLSECDFLVCTFSSQVCRLAYELLQSKRVDGSGRFVSLDNSYYYGGGNPLHQKVIIAHEPRTWRELELRKGDVLVLAGNHWNGSSTGTNLRTKKVGLYPSYKAKTMHIKVNFPDPRFWK